MKHFLRFLGLSTFGVALSVTVTHAFYDEVLALRNELQLYESAHAADFSDVIGELDDITGSVFTDIKKGDWFEPYVNSLSEWGIVSGYRDAKGKSTGMFMPGNSVTVAEALKMSMKAAKVDESTCTGKPSHAEAVGHWAETYVRCAEVLRMRIVAPAKIALNRKATRAEIVAMVHDAFGDKAPAMLSGFKDVAKSEYESDIAYAVLRGIAGGDKKSDGTPSGTFRPSAAINRAEVSKILYQRLKIAAKQELAAKGTDAL